ncbi:NACHT, LRR and PYD domains-containing protein 1, partial [Hondaea fermentalgiana]
LWEILIGSNGAKALAGALKENSSLKDLSLVKNNIGPDGAKALAGALKENFSLQKLDLSENKIGSDGAKALAGALKENSSLQDLILAFNEIGPDGAKALAGALKENSCMLEWLDIHGNDIRDEGAEDLASAIETNDILQKFSLDGYKISSDILARIRDRATLVQRETFEINATAHEALKANEKVHWGRTKLMVVGKAAAGKTSTIRTLLNQPFNPSHDSTIGVQLTLMRTRDWKERMKVCDADLGEQFAKYKYHRQILVEGVSQIKPDLESRVSDPRMSGSQASESRKSESRESVEHRASMRFNEEDIAKVIRPPLLVQVKKQTGTPDEEVSFTIWDYGGQEVFYALHHLFLTQYGIYVLVFDMREVLGKDRFAKVLDEKEFENLASQEDALNTLRFWIDSIRLHAPSVNVAL